MPPSHSSHLLTPKPRRTIQVHPLTVIIILLILLILISKR